MDKFIVGFGSAPREYVINGVSYAEDDGTGNRVGFDRWASAHAAVEHLPLRQVFAAGFALP